MFLCLGIPYIISLVYSEHKTQLSKYISSLKHREPRLARYGWKVAKQGYGSRKSNIDIIPETSTKPLKQIQVRYSEEVCSEF